MIPRKLSVDEISFGAHVDYSQNSEFIEAVNAQHIVSLLRLLTFSAHFIACYCRCLSMANKMRWVVSGLRCRTATKAEMRTLRYTRLGTSNLLS